MEKSNIRKLIDEAVKCGSGKLEAIKVYGSYGNDGAVVRRIITVESFVTADIRALVELPPLILWSAMKFTAAAVFGSCSYAKVETRRVSTRMYNLETRRFLPTPAIL